MANSQNGEQYWLFPFQIVWNSVVHIYSIHFHSKWFETVQSISFHFHSIHLHSKCIISKHSFYLFHLFLLFGMIKIILTKHSFYSFHQFHLFRMVKTILTILNENDKNSQKWLFQTGLSLLQCQCDLIITYQYFCYSTIKFS